MGWFGETTAGHALTCDFRTSPSFTLTYLVCVVCLTDACVGCGARRCGVACKLCSSCHSVRYCSIACQRSHWPTHKASCKASSKANANSGSSSGGGSTRSAPATGSNSGTKAAVVAMDLHRAAAAGQTATVRRLVAEGTSVHAVVDDETPLHKAAEKGHTHTARALLQLGADKEAGGRAGARPLHVAAKRGQLEMVKVLLAEGAHVDGRSDDGVTPLTLCVAADEQHAGHLAVARLLVLEAGADVEATTVATAGGFRPLHLAASVGAECMVRVLVGELGANKEACAFAQRTRPLHLAAGGGHPGTIRALVELGADLEATSDGGETPLQHAAMANMVPAVKTLVALGAKLDARDSRGMTALQRKQRVDRVHADDQDMLDALTELEDAARQKAAASERLRREHERADRAAAALLQQEEEQLEEKQKTNNKGSRKERHRQRKLEQASEMLDVAMAVMAESGVRCVCVCVCA
jgi:ankyrin repeat protein